MLPVHIVIIMLYLPVHIIKLNSTEVVAVFISSIKTCLGITGVGR